jgi:hypothetical protein
MKRCLFVAAFTGLLLTGSLVQSYIEVAYSLGQVLNESTQICLVEITKVDKAKGLIIFKKLKDLKGVHPEKELKHNIGKRGFHPREWQTVMAWADVGKKAVFFTNGGASETCIENYWYQCYKEGAWWGMSHGEPFLLRSYCGDPEKLAGFVSEMLKGKEVVVPCMQDHPNKQLLHERKGKMQLMKASTKLSSYNAKRDFVAWGTDLASAPQYRTVVLLPESTIGWKYSLASAEVTASNSWIQSSYKDAGWRLGQSPIGYGQAEIHKRGGTIIGDKGRDFVFRRQFDVPPELLEMKGVQFRLCVASDDTATVWINGRLADQDPAIDHDFVYWNRDVELQKGIFKPGKNLVAVYVKNHRGSSDLYMDLEISASLLIAKKPAPVVKQPDKQPPATSLAEYKVPIPAALKIDAKQKEISLPCQIAPRKLPTLKEIYPIEVMATYPTPKGLKAHETVVVFEKIKPLAVHKALVQLGLKPGQPVQGEGKASGPELELFLEFTKNGKKQRVPFEQTLVDTKANKKLPPLKWHFTGSSVTQPDPEKNEYAYGANLSGTLITLYPVTDQCVIQANLNFNDQDIYRLETNKNLLPPEGGAATLIIRVK